MDLQKHADDGNIQTMHECKHAEIWVHAHMHKYGFMQTLDKCAKMQTLDKCAEMQTCRDNASMQKYDNNLPKSMHAET